MDVETANGFTKFLKYVLDPEAEFSEEMNRVYETLNVGTPIINNLVVEVESGKQYLVSVKPVSGWKV